MRKFVVKVFVNEQYSFKVVSADSEEQCRESCKSDDIVFIFEVDTSIYHWSSYEISMFYGWIDQEKCFLPLDCKEVIEDYLKNNCKKRNEWLSSYVKLFGESMDSINTFNQYNKCLSLLKEVPEIKRSIK